MKSLMQDVLIIGAGPIGSYTAKHLAKQGFKVTVIEKRKRLGNPVCCAGIISPACANLMDIGETPVVIRRFNSANVYSPSRRVINISRSETQAVTVNRGLLDEIMAIKAEEAGAIVLYGQEVVNISIDNDSVKVQTDPGHGLTLEGKMVIVAAGFNPVLNSCLGIGRPGDFAIGAQAIVETAGTNGDLEIYLGKAFAPGFFGWFQPLNDTRALAGLLSRKNTAFHFERFFEYLRTNKFARLDGKPRFRGVSLKPLTCTCRDRLMVIGDAAGQVKPLTGGGLYYGLRAAIQAIDVVSQAFSSGDFSARSLNKYQHLWQRELLRDIKHGRFARKLFESFNDRYIDSAFRAIEKEKLAEKLAGDLTIGFDDHGRVVSKAFKKPSFYRALLRMVFS